jgi:hypothetical protein
MLAGRRSSVGHADGLPDRVLVPHGVSATVPVQAPGFIAVGASGVWVVSADTRLVRLDPTTAQPTATVSISAATDDGRLPVTSILVAGSNLWVSVAESTPRPSSTILRIALATDRLVDEEQKSGIITLLSADANGLLATRADGSLVRIATNGHESVGGQLPGDPGPGGVRVTPAGIGWALTSDGRVYPFDPSTGERTGAEIANTAGDGWLLAVGGRRVWVLGPGVLDEIGF